ncbi:MAG TPA: histidine phosphatase family protein [Bacteroidales bacterium]
MPQKNKVMMKKLIFIRHGRAEDQAFEISDFERSLTPKGKTISKLMARSLREKENSMGMMLTSTAFRALETAYIFAVEFGIKPESIRADSNLYYKMNIHYMDELLSVIEDENEVITLFGHNPSFTEIADNLCKEGCDFIPKCGIIGISFNIEKWSDLKHHTGKMEYFLIPEKPL